MMYHLEFSELAKEHLRTIRDRYPDIVWYIALTKPDL